MKSFKIIVFTISILSFQTSFNSPSYFFKQVGMSAAAGVVTGLVFKNECDPILISGGIVSYVTLKFFYDVLSAQGGTDIAKGFFSVPLNSGVAIAACLIAKSIAR